jgi:hypothetical protein
MSGHTASKLRVVCVAGAATYTKSVLRKGIHLPHQYAATDGWRKKKKPIPPIIGAADTRRRCSKGSCREHPRLQWEGCSLQISPPEVCPSRWRSEAAQSNKQRSQTHLVAVAGPVTMELRVPPSLHLHEQQATGQLVRAANVNSLSE